MKAGTFAWILVLPALVSVFSLNFFPTVYTAVITLSKTQLSGAQEFVGLGNFAAIVVDEDFQRAIILSLEFAGIAVAICTAVGLGLALVSNETFWGSGFLRSILVVPWATPWVVTGLMFSFIYDWNYGYLNTLMLSMGLIEEKFLFLSTQGALFFTAFACAWTLSSFTAVFLLAALRAIEPVYYEAAEIDGADSLGRFRHITLPHIQPILNMTVLWNSMIAISMFDIIFVMTKGGPGTSTLVLSIQAFREYFVYTNLGQGAATALVLAAVTIAVGLPYLTLFYRRRAYR